MEFDANGKLLRGIADDLFVTAHTVRVDAEDTIWTTDVGTNTPDHLPGPHYAKPSRAQPRALLQRAASKHSSQE
jgi:hypothetical protein